jgi:hypothetical protein
MLKITKSTARRLPKHIPEDTSPSLAEGIQHSTGVPKLTPLKLTFKDGSIGLFLKYSNRSIINTQTLKVYKYQRYPMRFMVEGVGSSSALFITAWEQVDASLDFKI